MFVSSILVEKNALAEGFHELKKYFFAIKFYQWLAVTISVLRSFISPLKGSAARNVRKPRKGGVRKLANILNVLGWASTYAENMDGRNFVDRALFVSTILSIIVHASMTIHANRSCLHGWMDQQWRTKRLESGSQNSH